MQRRIWFERSFDLGYGAEVFPEVLERVRGAPARLEERLQDVPGDVLSRRDDDRWSILEEVGHFGDLELLWSKRLTEILSGSGELAAADVENTATHAAGHNDVPVSDLLARFRSLRAATVRTLDGLTPADLERTALHPRLGQPMSITDLFFFVAEHDDHHLATITDLLGRGDAVHADDPRYPIGPFSPHDRSLTAEEREALIEAIESHPVGMRAAVDGLTDERLDTPYRAGGWTVRQVVHHVVDSHMNAYARFRLAATEELPTIRTYDEKAWAALPDARSEPVELSLAILDAMHPRWVAQLRGMDAEYFERPLDHPEVGNITTGVLLQLYGWHCAHHEAHITRLRDRMGW